ncbi:hypothetical protein [Flavobacterium sp. 5]|uniref:hypothetical protein n=1 Tax=Flavobacterium sp. 5 TaxID=2035199 RepID=UPI000C2C96DF|nr:hypothetical protein [Flavobacterium sp. 5]PKB15250.1 hypothetical protein CLU82_0314 [Flavobacterium sp. 5]
MTKIKEESSPICGIVMPISAIDGCTESHWNDVMEIINDCIEEAGFEPNIVSNADDIGVIQKRIIQNLYDNPVVVCDVSGKNPNVMFELGLRLAFDKPTIIIKDDQTSYSFDTSPIEHIEYPRDLRFNKIADFKIKLIDKIIKTHHKSIEDPHYSTFLKHFGEFKVAKIDKKEVSQQEYIMDEIKSLRRLILNTSNTNKRIPLQRYYEEETDFDKKLNVCCGKATLEKLTEQLSIVLNLPNVESAKIESISEDHHHLDLILGEQADKDFIRTQVRKLTRVPNNRKTIQKK